MRANPEEESTGDDVSCALAVAYADADFLGKGWLCAASLEPQSRDIIFRPAPLVVICSGQLQPKGRRNERSL